MLNERPSDELDENITTYKYELIKELPIAGEFIGDYDQTNSLVKELVKKGYRIPTVYKNVLLIWSTDNNWCWKSFKRNYWKLDIIPFDDYFKLKYEYRSLNLKKDFRL